MCTKFYTTTVNWWVAYCVHKEQLEALFSQKRLDVFIDLFVVFFLQKMDYVTYLTVFDRLFDVPKERKNASYKTYVPVCVLVHCCTFLHFPVLHFCSSFSHI